MNSLISFRSLDASRIYSGLTADILQLAQDENKEVMKISVSAREDTKTLKTITILTLIYLPASFVSVSNTQQFYRQECVADTPRDTAEHGVCEC
jgi:hypothetical protein